MTDEIKARRINYIAEHRDAIVVRERIAGTWQHLSIGELLNVAPELVRTHVDRMVASNTPPHCALREGEERWEIDW